MSVFLALFVTLFACQATAFSQSKELTIVQILRADCPQSYQWNEVGPSAPENASPASSELSLSQILITGFTPDRGIFLRAALQKKEQAFSKPSFDLYFWEGTYLSQKVDVDLAMEWAVADVRLSNGANLPAALLRLAEVLSRASRTKEWRALIDKNTLPSIPHREIFQAPPLPAQAKSFEEIWNIHQESVAEGDKTAAQESLQLLHSISLEESRTSQPTSKKATSSAGTTDKQSQSKAERAEKKKQDRKALLEEADRRLERLNAPLTAGLNSETKNLVLEVFSLMKSMPQPSQRIEDWCQALPSQELSRILKRHLAIGGKFSSLATDAGLWNLENTEAPVPGQLSPIDWMHLSESVETFYGRKRALPLVFEAMSAPLVMAGNTPQNPDAMRITMRACRKMGDLAFIIPSAQRTRMLELIHARIITVLSNAKFLSTHPAIAWELPYLFVTLVKLNDLGLAANLENDLAPFHDEGINNEVRILARKTLFDLQRGDTGNWNTLMKHGRSLIEEFGMKESTVRDLKNFIVAHRDERAWKELTDYLQKHEPQGTEPSASSPPPWIASQARLP